MKFQLGSSLKIVAWLALIAIAIVTVVPIEMRPTTSLSPNRERFIVMAIVGGLFALAYPKRFWIVLVALFAAAAVLEPLQFLAAGRHPSTYDAIIKCAGASAGVVSGYLIIRAAELIGPRKTGLKAKK